MKNTKTQNLNLSSQSKMENILTWISYILLVFFAIAITTTLIFFLIYVPKIKNQSTSKALQNYEETKILLNIITVSLAGVFGIIKVIQYGIYLSKTTK